MQYNRARSYDAETGRWISEDPMGFAAGDTSLSRYIRNNITNATDASDLQEAPKGWESWFTYQAWSDWWRNTGTPASGTAATYLAPFSEPAAVLGLGSEGTRAGVLIITRGRMLEEMAKPQNMRDPRDTLKKQHDNVTSKMNRVFATPGKVKTIEEGTRTPSIGESNEE